MDSASSRMSGLGLLFPGSDTTHASGNGFVCRAPHTHEDPKLLGPDKSAAFGNLIQIITSLNYSLGRG